MAQVIVARHGPLVVFQRGPSGAAKILAGNDTANAARFAGNSASSATLSQEWAEGTEPGGPGTKSAKGWSEDIQARVKLDDAPFPAIFDANRAEMLGFDRDYGFVAKWGRDAIKKMRDRLADLGLEFRDTASGFPAMFAGSVQLLGFDAGGKLEAEPSADFAYKVGNLIPKLATLNTNPSTAIAAVGDSMTALVNFATLSGAVGVPVQNLGIGSQTSEEVLARFGPRPALLTIDNNEVPASGAVNVTAYDIDALYNTGRSGDISITGTYGGVPVTWSGIPTTGNHGIAATTLTRIGSGSAVKVAPGTPFIPDNLALYRNRTILSCIGRNMIDPATGAMINTAILTDDQIAQRLAQWEEAVLAMDSVQTTINARVVHRSVTTVTASGSNPTAGEIAGTQGYKLITQINARGAKLFGDRWIDERAFLIAHASTVAAAIGVTLTTGGSNTDESDLAADAVPRSFRADNTHYITPVNDWLQANLHAPRLQSLGWY